MGRYKHGHARNGKVHRLHNIWRGMIKRCKNMNDSKYGARGISICEEWKKDYMLFFNWSISNGYKSGLSIDRIDNNGNYKPSNCRWVNSKVQARNRRTSFWITHNGVKKTVAEWAEVTGINYATLLYRVKKGYPIETAFAKELPKKEKKIKICTLKPKKKPQGYYFDKNIGKEGRYRVEFYKNGRRYYGGCFVHEYEAKQKAYELVD